MEPSDSNSKRAFVIFVLCAHCIEIATKETIKTLGSNYDISKPIDINDLLLDKEISKYFLYWSTELVWNYSETPELADILNPIIISLFEEKYPIKFNEVKEYSDIPKDSSEIIQRFGKNIASIFDACGAITIYEICMEINTNLKVLIPAIQKALATPDSEIDDMLAE